MNIQIDTLIHAMEVESTLIPAGERQDEFKRAIEMVREFERVQRMTVGDSLNFANVNKYSKYAGQAARQPFPVELVMADDGYIFWGNSNRYRLTDLDFYWLEGGTFHPVPANELQILRRGTFAVLADLDPDSPDHDLLHATLTKLAKRLSDA